MRSLSGAGALPHDPSPLGLLAARHGVEVSYEDATGRRREVGEETLVKLLAALGEPIARPRDAAAVIDGEQARWHEGDPSPPPVVVAWDGSLPPLQIAPADARHGVDIALALEDGADGGDLVRLEVRDGATVVVGCRDLPFGLHELAVARTGGVRRHLHEAGSPERSDPEPDRVTVISAPARARPVPEGSWGVFAPAYGLRDGDRHGDLSCLERLGVLAAGAGARYVGTLPLLADLSRSDDPAGSTEPYAPLSRLWWNEGYLDPARVPELSGLLSPEELSIAGRAPGQTDVGRRAAALRPALEEAARRLERAGGDRLRRYKSFLAERPGVLVYGRFRAACERAGAEPSRWPAAWRLGLIDEDVLDAGAVAAHVFAQFALDEQLSSVARTLGSAGAGILLDLPVGCKPSGFDPWAYPESFANGASVGAPPDQFFSAGQDWGFRPLHPAGERSSGYEVSAAALRNVLRHASALRVDHAMGLARLWWIPDGLAPTEGAYVRYELDEMLALSCLEASRAGAVLVGEDLGTVETSLRRALSDHGVAGMHVAVFDLEDDEAHPMEPLEPREGSVALVDTHDTATFAGWFSGHDLERRRELGLAGPDDVAAGRAARRIARNVLVDRLVASDLLAEEDVEDPVAVHEGLLGELGASPAGLVLVNLEDCWGELDPQNIPGTTTEHANFSRELARSLGEVEADESVASAFHTVNRARRGAIRDGLGG